MARPYWDPFEEFERLQEEMNKFQEAFFGRPADRLLEGPGGDAAPMRRPEADVMETETDVIATIDMPGVDKKDINVTIDEDGIEVSAQKKHEIEQKDKGYYRLERRYAGFYRKMPLPAPIKPGDAKAEYKDGVLRITAPKAEKALPKGKRLEIK